MSSAPVLLITGGNTGIGYEVLKALCKSSKAYDILLGGRDIKKAQDAVAALKAEFPSSASSIAPIQIDISQDASIEKAFQEVSSTKGKLDILINNAGASMDNDIVSGALSIREAWNKSWDVNVSGTQVMTHTFVPLLLKAQNARLLFVTSGTSSLNETEDFSNPMTQRLNASPEQGWPKQEMMPITAYRSSKTGLNMMMRDWNRLLKNDGVKVWAISPGFLATGLGSQPEKLKKMGAGDPSIGGEFIRDVVEGARDQDVGKVIRKDMIQPW